MPNLKQIGGGHRKNGQKFVDLMWNDPCGIIGQGGAKFAPHDKFCDIFRAAIKSLFFADMLSLRM